MLLIVLVVWARRFFHDFGCKICLRSQEDVQILGKLVCMERHFYEKISVIL